MAKFSVGQKVFEFTLRQRIPDNPNRSPIMKNRWRAECSCGKMLTIPEFYFLRKNPKKSCGHLNQSLRTKYKQEYGIWYMMRRRCNEPTFLHYKHYGGRGISVCPQWNDFKTGFEQFLADVGPRPNPKLTIDRIENDGNYEPGNVRWATAKQQRENQRPRK